MKILRPATAALRTAIVLVMVGGIQGIEAAESEWGGLPAGKGRNETFAFCTACHSAKLIIQQGMTRDQWDETLVWMVEEQAMPEPPTALRELILDYLATQFPPNRPHYQRPGQ